MTASRQDLVARDADDPLAPFRDKFDLPDGIIYLDGNSLGALPKATAGRLDDVVRNQWGRDLIKSWNTHDWIGLPHRLGDKIARLVGAKPGEVVAADSTSVNLFKMLAAALRLRPDRKTILSDARNFPTDLYVAQGIAGLLDNGVTLRLMPEDRHRSADERVPEALDDDVAVVSLTHVDFKSGEMHDMARITEAVHAAGALMLWDLAHSAGALPVDLNAANADLAVGCGYKYLNGGPGAPAFLYVAERLQNDIRPPLSGWMGHEAPFAFDTDYRPAAGINRNLCGTPGILGQAALEVGLDLMLEADMAEIRAKSVALCELFVDLIERRCAEFGFTLASPRDADRRGSQINIAHPEGYAIMQALIAHGVIGDFRAPDILRFGFTPLYTRYVDIWDAVEILRDIMATGAWDDPEFKARSRVT